MDIVFVDGKIAADRAATLIIKVKRISPNIKIMALAEDETDKTRVLDYGADEFATKPISAEAIVDGIFLCVDKNFSRNDVLSLVALVTLLVSLVIFPVLF